MIERSTFNTLREHKNHIMHNDANNGLEIFFIKEILKIDFKIGYKNTNKCDPKYR